MSKSAEQTHLPVLGVGPYYVAGIFTVTFAASFAQYLGWLESGEIVCGWVKALIIALGVLVIVEAVAVWCLAVFGSRMVESVKNSQLMTGGVYAWVRHPVYAAFLFLNTGLLLVQANWWLMVLPITYWLALSVLMKHTEERWLFQQFGDQYTQYVARVNRAIPWPPRKTN